MTFIDPIVEAILLPPGLFLLLLAVAFVVLRVGRKRLGITLAAVAALLIYLFSIRPVADLLLLPLENRYQPYLGNSANGAHYVVVLGGGIVPVSPAEGGKGSLGSDSLKRLVFGVRLAAKTRLPLIFSGGIVPSHLSRESEAAVAKRTIDELDTAGALGKNQPRILTEGESRNTWENARMVESRFHPVRVILVTSAYHMPRSVLAFNRNHISVIPAPTDYLADRTHPTFYSFLPDAASMRDCTIALKEYMGYFYYRFFLTTAKRSS